MRSIGAHRIRFALTTLSVLVGVAFVVASFVLADGLRATFDAIVQDANENTDAQVRARTDFDEVDFVDSPIDEALLDVVLGVEGVAEAQPTASSGKIVPVKADGEAVSSQGPPILSFNWVASDLSVLTIVEGEAPTGPGEFAVDEGTASREDFEVGQTYDIIGVAGREPFTLTGITRFGDESALAGAVLMSFELEELQRLNDSDGQLVAIEVAAEDGVSPEQLISNLEAALPPDVEAVDSEIVIEEGQDDFGVFVDIFGNILLAFALVSVFVSAFIINNTFNIVLGQRVRELALLRALGASVRQVRSSAVLEAALIGVFASIVGIGAGVALAFGLRGVMNALGFSLPNLELILSARTVVWAVVVGLGITLVASLSPARKAGAVPPIAAMGSGYRLGSGESLRRTIVGAVVGALGLVLMVLALTEIIDDTTLLLVALGAGAIAVFVAAALLSPLFASPVARFLGAPLEHLPWLGPTGRMARQNSGRDNKRTAATAAGLMIGLALVVMAAVVATSLKDSFRDSLSSTVEADYIVSTANFVGFSPELANGIAASDQFDAVSSMRFGTVRVDGDEKDITAVDFAVLPELLAIDVVAGDPTTAADPDSIILNRDVADDMGLGVGDPIVVEFAATGDQTLTVAAIYDAEFLIGDYAIDLTGWDANFTLDEDFIVLAALAPDANMAEVDAAVAAAGDAFPQLEIETREEFRERQEGQLDSLLIVINVFLGLAIVIALLGITNTMALSVFERTREIGLMRAIGMTRRQTRSMIRWEAAVVSLFGALLGAVIGVAFGWAAVTAIPGSIIDTLAIPWGTVVIYILAATVAGLVAAAFPARRAARLNMLEAIAHL